MQYDVVIIGAGVAGLYAALHLPSSLKVLILCKQNPKECNTFYAQGGISVALNQEDITSHIQDTLKAGAYLNDVQALKILSTHSLSVIDDLGALGMSVDRSEDGKILYAQEGGHSRARIVHFEGDGSGRILHTQLLANLKHLLWDQAQVIDLFFAQKGREKRCGGVVLCRNGEILRIKAQCVILASGGVGGLYAYHTNASTINADLHGIILKHGLKLRDMEMMQFHPSVHICTQNQRQLLISEAVRGVGGKIIDGRGRRFLFDYDARGELAPRDILSRGIFEYGLHHDVFLDLQEVRDFAGQFPFINQTLKALGYQIPQDKIPISPAFHYCMGGIEVDLEGRVRGVSNLYAIGECASNRIHGANRLASNSLLEGLVFGKKVAEAICDGMQKGRYRGTHDEVSDANAPHYVVEKLFQSNDLQIEQRLKQIMWEKVGIIRTEKGLQEALDEVIEMLKADMGDICALHLNVAKEVITQALARKESLGAHFLQDA